MLGRKLLRLCWDVGQSCWSEGWRDIGDWAYAESVYGNGITAKNEKMFGNL